MDYFIRTFIYEKAVNTLNNTDRKIWNEEIEKNECAELETFQIEGIHIYVRQLNFNGVT